MNKKFFSPFIQRLTIYQHLINKQKRYKKLKTTEKLLFQQINSSFK